MGGGVEKPVMGFGQWLGGWALRRYWYWIRNGIRVPYCMYHNIQHTGGHRIVKTAGTKNLAWTSELPLLAM